MSGNNHKTYYNVRIEELYAVNETDKPGERNKKITQQFLKENFKEAIFERYPLAVFNKKIIFHINGEKVEPENFIIGTPEKIAKTYIDKKGQESKVYFNYFKLKRIDDIRVFLMVKNAGIETVANSFKFDATWLSPKIGGWYIYILSDTLTSDNYRNIDLDGLDEELSNYRSFIKDKLNSFFKEKNKEYDNFIDSLKQDVYYPYKEKKATSKSKELLFDKLAYIVEDKYNILKHKDKIREIIYPLIDKTISNGELENILKEILKLDKKLITKFHLLLEKSELESIIEFSEKVASKKESLEFLEKLVYSDISKSIKERKELHKFLEHMLWIFGEEYNDSTTLLSDKSLKKNLEELREKFLKYSPSIKDNNIAELQDRNVKSITDLFMYSEKIIDQNKREVLIIELKAPKVKISPKELGQVKKYATEIEKLAFFPDRLKYKILLISTDINDDAKFEIDGNQQSDTDNPYFFFKNKSGNIEIWVIKWIDLFENIKRKLNYLSAILQTKDVDVLEMAKRDFADIEFNKTYSSLTKVAI